MWLSVAALNREKVKIGTSNVGSPFRIRVQSKSGVRSVKSALVLPILFILKDILEILPNVLYFRDCICLMVTHERELLNYKRT